MFYLCRSGLVAAGNAHTSAISLFTPSCVLHHSPHPKWFTREILHLLNCLHALLLKNISSKPTLLLQRLFFILTSSTIALILAHLKIIYYIKCKDVIWSVMYCIWIPVMSPQNKTRPACSLNSPFQSAPKGHHSHYCLATLILILLSMSL